MRSKVACALALLIVGNLAVPAGASIRTGAVIKGTVTDAVTGKPFPAGYTVGVDVFETGTLARTRVWIGDPAGKYQITGLPAGQYKVRFRVWDGSDRLIRYRWHNNRPTFAAATAVTVGTGATVTINGSLSTFAGAAVSGKVTERGTGLPLGASGCIFVELFEASGISMGVLNGVEPDGTWRLLGKAPAGSWAALAGYWKFVGGCEQGPTHLDTWRGGASGYPLHPDDASADPVTFATAKRFTVVAGTPLGNINLSMPPAPTCRGKTPTIFGTTLADNIVGTSGRDIISGLAGDDTIKGLGGNDLLCGDEGNDRLYGGPGVDVADGGAGSNDICVAETVFRCES